MINERKRIEEQIQILQQQLATLPAGKLVFSHYGKYSKWYHSYNHEKRYIPKKERHLAEQLAAKKYLSLRLAELSLEKKAIDQYLSQLNSTKTPSSQLLIEDSKYAELLAPFFTPLSKELFDWARNSYPTNPKFPEQLIHKSPSGNLLRSKSEALIDAFLYKNKIPFRYECVLQLDDITLYPDFTIRHPINGKTYYWEHFGIMDNPDYSKKTYSKLQLYTSHNIIPTIQLITTYETKQHPLNIEDIEKIIQHYFL